MLHKNMANKILIGLLKRYRSKSSFDSVDVKIPVPWGHVAGKWWGSTAKRPILVLHGYKDNCGSFDKLLPELSSKNSFLAIDLPGHGFSSHLPNGMFYNFLQGPLLIKRIKEYFKWSKVSLMGHSMGASYCFVFASCLPQQVDLLIGIDGAWPLIESNHTEIIGEMMENYIKLSERNLVQTKSSEMDKLIIKLHQRSGKSIDMGNCKYILQRNIAPSVDHPGKFQLTLDPCLNAGQNYEANLFDLDRVNCPISLTIVEGTPNYKEFYKKHFENHIQNLIKKPNTEFQLVQGTHHVILNQPKVIQKVLIPFLAKYSVEDFNTKSLP